MKMVAIMGSALLATAAQAADPDIRAIEAATHGAYVAAINSNDIDRVMAVLSDDIVYQAPNEPEIIGKPAVRAWGRAYFDAYRTHWDKRTIAFRVSGDWAFERYTYRVADTDKETGAVSHDEGKGINIFHHDRDGKWRVAIDGWSSDRPADH